VLGTESQVILSMKDFSESFSLTSQLLRGNRKLGRMLTLGA